MKKYLSIDIGGTNIKYGLIQDDGQILESHKTKTFKDKVTFLALIEEIIGQYADQISGIAFCAPGKIQGTSIRFGGALPFLDGIDFKQEFATYNLPILGVNDGKAGVLAEHWQGSLQGVDNCAAIILGTGVGGGIIINGKLLNGSHFQAGELSFMQLAHMPLETGDSFSDDGFAGSLLSAVRMITQINQKLGNPDITDGLTAFEAIKTKHPIATKIFEEYCQNVAQLILNIQTVVDLQKIAIGGGISAQPILLEGIQHAYDKLFDANPLIKTTLNKALLTTAHFQNEANMIGALNNLLENNTK